MGCCFSDNSSTSGQTNDVNETTSLLHDGKSSKQSSHAQPIGDYSKDTSGSFTKSDQQSMLSRILNQTANNVIDVSAVEPHSLEKNEYLERAKQYENYANVGNNARIHHQESMLPPGTAAPQIVLAAEPVSTHDLQLVKRYSKETSSALKSFEVSGGEPFVVQFGGT